MASSEHRKMMRNLVLELLGHAPDPELCYADICDSMKIVKTPMCRGAAMCLSCAEHGEVVQDVPGSTMDDGRRAEIITKVLRGRCIRREEKELRDSMVFQSRTLEIRTKFTPKLAIKWLKGRRDLLRYVPTLVGVAGMGAGVFCSYVASLTSGGAMGLHDLLLDKRCYTCCIKCALESQKEFKVNVRFGSVDRPELDGEMFDWQYATHMLGRFEHEVFADREDLEDRVNYDATMPVHNGVYGLKDEFDDLYEEEIAREGRRFGSVCAHALLTSDQPYHNLTEMALTKIPTGSIGSYGVNDLASSEVDKMHLNKKLAIIYMTKGEEEATKYGQMHARSGWLWKLEIAKLRNLVPGTLGYYLSSARVSAYGEARFLGTLDGVPLMWSEARKEKADAKFAGWQDYGYVACRDYKNYNMCHKHERMQMFYREAAGEAQRLGAVEMANDFKHMIACLDDVGVYVDGEYKKWEYGLQTGWAHTMLFHCVHNSCAGRVAAKIVERYTGWRRLVASHQGDDSREVWSNPLAGPLAQAILDAGGQVGQPEKQHFARDRKSWAEFLRVWYRGGLTRGSTLRMIGGFVSADSQHSPQEGGMEMLKTVVTGINDIWRRQGGKIEWRRSDIEAILAFWSASNEGFRLRGSVDWRAVLSERFGLSVGPYPEMRWTATGGKVVRKKRYNVEIGPGLLKRSRRNLQAVGRAPGVYAYAKEYATDMIMSSVEMSADMIGVKVAPACPLGESDAERRLHRVLVQGAKRVVGNCLQGRQGWQDRDEFDRQVTINHLFAGSESVALSYVKTQTSISLRGAHKLRENISHGLKILAGKTSVDKPKLKCDLVCAKKYWPHVEIYLREAAIPRICQGILGRLVATEAMWRGEWI